MMSRDDSLSQARGVGNMSRECSMHPCPECGDMLLPGQGCDCMAWEWREATREARRLYDGLERTGREN